MKKNRCNANNRNSKSGSQTERTLRRQAGFYLSPEEIENKAHMEDNMDHLRCVASVKFDMYGEVSELREEFDEERYEEISRKLRKRHKNLEEKKKLGEIKCAQNFSSTEMFEHYELTEEEQTVVLQLFSMKGIGFQPDDPYIPGETIIVTLNVLHDTTVEDAWMILNKYSKLVDSGIIKRIEPDDHVGVEGSYYTISELGMAQLLDIEKIQKKQERSLARRLDLRPPKILRDDGDGEEETEEEKDIGPLEKIDSKVCFENDVILPKVMKEDVRGVITQIQNKEKFESWGMDDLLGEHTGVTMLYSGESGTGKTLAARAIGNLLGKDTYYLSFPKLLSHWYSKTEQNVGKMFDIINSLDGVLVLDEADGLLNKRSEPMGCADATENRIVTIFLQELERSSAIIVMTTNISGIMDKALDRRLDLKLEFPMPDEDAREKIWYAHLPEKLPLADDVDIPFLAKRYEFSGGKIKNSVVSAVRYALSRDADEVTQEDLVKACEKVIEGTEAMDHSISDDSTKVVRGYS